METWGSKMAKEHPCGCVTERKIFCEYETGLTVYVNYSDIVMSPCERAEAGESKEFGCLMKKDVRISDILREVLKQFDIAGGSSKAERFEKCFFRELCRLAEVKSMLTKAEGEPPF